nr:hypothetical protein [Candidatus Sigynarchaeota archaeon]
MAEIVVADQGDGAIAKLEIFSGGIWISITDRMTRSGFNLWSTQFNTTAYADGIYRLCVSILDDEGQTGTKELPGIEIDNSAPLISMTDLDNNAVLGAPVTVQISASPDTRRVQYQYVMTGRPWTEPNIVTLRDDTGRFTNWAYEIPVFEIHEKIIDFRVVAYDELNDPFQVGIDMRTNILIQMLAPVIVAPTNASWQNGTIEVRARSNSTLTSRAKLYYAATEDLILDHVTAWTLVDFTTDAQADVWILHVDPSDFGFISSWAFFRVQFELEGSSYSESTYIVLHVDTIIPEPMLLFAPGSEPVGNAFINVPAVYFELGGAHLDDLAKASFYIRNHQEGIWTLDSAVTAGKGNWTHFINTATLPDDVYDFKLVVTDASNNIASSEISDIRIDSGSPTAFIYAPLNAEHVWYNASVESITITGRFYCPDDDIDTNSVRAWYKPTTATSWDIASADIQEVKIHHYMFTWTFPASSIPPVPMFDLKVNGSDTLGNAFDTRTCFIMDSVLDVVDPIFDAVVQPDSNVTWGTRVFCNLTMHDDNGLLMLEIFDGAPAPLGELDPAKTRNLITRIYSPSSTVLLEINESVYTFNPGCHDLIFRLIDTSWNTALYATSITISSSILNIANNSIIHATGAGNDLNVTLMTMRTDIAAVNFTLFRAVGAMWTVQDSLADFEGTDGWGCVFSGVNSGQYKIEASTSSFSSICYPVMGYRVATVLFGVDNDAPHDVNVTNLEPGFTTVTASVVLNVTAIDENGIESYQIYANGSILDDGYFTANGFVWLSYFTAPG